MKMKSLSMLGAVAIVVGLALPAHAAKKEPVGAFFTNEGIAFSYQKVTKDDDGNVTERGPLIAYDPVATYHDEVAMVANCSQFSLEHKGVIWCFANAKNKATFVARAALKDKRNVYEPFVGGGCTLGISYANLRAKGNPQTVIVIGKSSDEYSDDPAKRAEAKLRGLMIFNGSLAARSRFLGDTERAIDSARGFWKSGLWSGQIVPNDQIASSATQ